VHEGDSVSCLAPAIAFIVRVDRAPGAARKPPVFIQPADVFEVEIEGTGVPINPVHDK